METLGDILDGAVEAGRWLLLSLVLLGAVPALCGIWQFLHVARHRWHDHYDRADPDHLPRTAIIVPAWNELAVLRFSIDAMMRVNYPPDRLRLVVVDDGSTDETPVLLAAKQDEYGDRVLPLRRENGGQGKAHTLNYGLDVVLADDWAEAVLITDADVVFEPTALRRMTRHLADPQVGAVNAFIREASSKPGWVNRAIGYEYVAAQAAGRRAQNVVRAQACLAGGAQLHSRANLEALGGRVDTTTLAEDTVTTFLTQIDGRKVIFDGNAECLAEEPGSVVALWKQRLRWSRGNVQVARRFGNLFFRRSREHHLGGLWFGLMWWSTLLMPALMIIASAALVTLWLADADTAWVAFRALWITCALGFVFTTFYTLLLDPRMARQSWLQAVMFPGLVSLAVMAWVLVPGPVHAAVHGSVDAAGGDWNAQTRSLLELAAYLWVSGCMVAAWLVYRLERWGHLNWLVSPLVALVGFGPLLCSITFAAYVAEARHAEARWDKTEKTGNVVGVRMSRDGRRELAEDARHERRVLWLGVVSVLFVAALILARHTWWVYG